MKGYRLLYLLLAASVVVCSSCRSSQETIRFNAARETKLPKREFRGAWMQVVNNQYRGLSTAEQQARLLSQLDALQQVGVNAVFFQVRPEGDAMYASELEPWSRFLTGRQGLAPSPYWDPLEFMVEACHARGMELHAWINPFRAKLKEAPISDLSSQHPYFRNPDRFVEYDGLLIFDPGLSVNRDYICKVAADIVRRYDVDGLHIDDYFYPYPVGGKAFGDDVTFASYSRGFVNKADWRRDNVNLFIQQLYTTVRQTKPWVKFGVSPFGIYHNGVESYINGVPGSATRGLQNYDDLYADVLLWINEGWVDYVIPQLYWEIGHTTADYAQLVGWWAQHANGRPLYIGQDLERSLRATDIRKAHSNQVESKFRMQRGWSSTDGYCWWYADAVRAALGTTEGKSSLLPLTKGTVALQPLYPWIDDKAPDKVTRPAVIDTSDGPVLCWTAPVSKFEADRAVRYAVYAFERDERVDIEESGHILAVTPQTFLPLQPYLQRGKYVLVITALDRLSNESKGTSLRVEL